jgi:hypothetical protein
MVGSSLRRPKVAAGRPTLVIPVRNPCWPVINDARPAVQRSSPQITTMFGFCEIAILVILHWLVSKTLVGAIARPGQLSEAQKNSKDREQADAD